MKRIRVGRPKAKLKTARHHITRRVRRLIDLAHEGNVHEASRATGIPYATVRDLYVGRSANPGHKTLKALVETYGVYDGWFTDSAQPEEVPVSGWVTYVSGFGSDASRDRRRDVVIPFAAWPLGNLYEELGDALEVMPVSVNRPIVSDAVEEKEFNRRLGDFFLAPLLLAETVSGKRMVLDHAAPEWDDRTEQEKWIRRMRVLGRYWADVLPEMIAGIRKLQSANLFAKPIRIGSNNPRERSDARAILD